MNKMELRKEAKVRVCKLKFGEMVTNVCAGENNPHRHGYFVQNISEDVECTDGIKEFWKTGCEVVFTGHLRCSECERIFAPIHKILYS